MLRIADYSGVWAGYYERNDDYNNNYNYNYNNDSKSGNDDSSFVLRGSGISCG